MGNIVVRLSSLTLKNIKNVKNGIIIMPLANERKFECSRAEILGIYGQNGSGKTAIVDALYFLQGIITGEELDQRIIDYIDTDSTNAEINAEFKIFGDNVLYEVGYHIIFSKIDDGVIIEREYLNRVSGNIKAVEMCEDSFFEIDEPSDWIIIEALMKKNGITANADETEVLKNVKLFLTDCDGCLTDGGMYYSEHGDELKKFNTRDGMGFGLLKKAGIKTGIVTSENVQLVQNRANKLKLDFLKMGAGDKLTVIKRICDEMHISLEETAYIGDDINDVAVIENVGFGCSVNNGMTQAKSAARYVTNANGGEGAIREVAELILAARS